MSQLHGRLATLQLPEYAPTTVLNVPGFRFSLMPSAAALDCSWVSSDTCHACPVA